MKTPRINPDFDKAADNIKVWRRLQKQALDADRHDRYEKLQAHQDKQLRAHAHKFHDREVELVNQETARLMREKHELSLRMLPFKKLRYSRAQSMARHNVFAQHERERQAMEKKHQDQRDAFLRREEQQRAARPQVMPKAPERAPEKAPEKANDNQAAKAFSAALKARALQKQAQRTRDQGRDR